MVKDVEAEMPKVKLATQEWVMTQIMDIERRIEKSFHDQTQFLSDRLERQTQRTSQSISSLTKWMVGLIITTAFTIIIAVLFQGA